VVGLLITTCPLVEAGSDALRQYCGQGKAPRVAHTFAQLRVGKIEFSSALAAR
jgi:hypothetical protein